MIAGWSLDGQMSRVRRGSADKKKSLPNLHGKVIAGINYKGHRAFSSGHSAATHL